METTRDRKPAPRTRGQVGADGVGTGKAGSAPGRTRSRLSLPGPLSIRAAAPVAGLLVVFLSGCGPGLTEQQRMWLAQGQEYYGKKDFGRAIGCLDRFLSEVREGPEVAQALYLRGLSNGQLGRRSQAYADLRGCTVTRSDTDAVWRAHVSLGTLHFEDQQWAQAVEHLRFAAERMPEAPPKDFVLYRLGLCQERSGRWQDARRSYAQIVEGFGSGGYAEAARRRLRLNADHFAVQCGAFRQQSNAQSLRLNLKQKGLDAYVREEVRGRTAMYLVLVGRYDTYEQALSHLAMVKQEFVREAILWP